jgi:hypothetical protein
LFPYYIELNFEMSGILFPLQTTVFLITQIHYSGWEKSKTSIINQAVNPGKGKKGFITLNWELEPLSFLLTTYILILMSLISHFSIFIFSNVFFSVKINKRFKCIRKIYHEHIWSTILFHDPSRICLNQH